MNREKAVIDGSNAAYIQAPRERRPNSKNILAIVQAVESSGRDPIIIIDPSIRTLVIDPDEFEKVLSDRRVILVPPGKDIDRVVLETAESVEAVIVSNNTYSDHYEDFPTTEMKRIPVAMINGAVLLLEKMKRAG